jgi:hypothetical protein
MGMVQILDLSGSDSLQILSCHPHTDRSGWAWKKKYLFIYNPIIIKHDFIKALKYQNQVKGF